MSGRSNVLINGVETDLVSSADRGLQFGDGLFETIAIEDGLVEYWPEHIQRLQHGASVLGIECPDEQVWLEDVRKCLDGRSGRWVIKIMLTRGFSERGYTVPPGLKPNRIVKLSAAPDWPARNSTDGILARRCQQRLSSNATLAGIKHLNRLDNVLARRELRSHQHEGIVCDQAGQPVEGTMSNLFCVAEGVLRTPEITDCGIDGVIRQRIIAGDHGVTCRIGLNETMLDDADEIFFCNSLIGIWPVRRLDDRDLQPGLVTRRMMTWLTEDREANRLDVEN